MKNENIYIALALILIIGGSAFVVTGGFLREKPQICFLKPLEPTSIDLYYECEELDDDVELKPANIDQKKLVDYSLELINADRERYNITQISFGSSTTAQKHADELLNICKTSYWDSTGMKPYMRYSASGGDGAINEIVRVVGTPEIQKHWTEDSIEQIIAWNQYSMVERDEANEWIYSMNILHPDHNYVNIGIAWNDSCISIVQQFEDRYIEWDQKPIITHLEQFMLSGRVSFNATVEQIDVFFDPIPMPLSDQELMNSPPLYAFGHICTVLSCFEGSLPIATIVPNSDPDAVSPEVLEQIFNQDAEIPLLVAHKWNVTQSEEFTDFIIEEDLTRLITLVGKGVYTILIWGSPTGTSDGMVLTTISIFLL